MSPVSADELGETIASVVLEMSPGIQHRLLDFIRSLASTQNLSREEAQRAMASAADKVAEAAGAESVAATLLRHVRRAY